MKRSRGLAVAALLLPSYTTTFEISAANENAELTRQIEEANIQTENLMSRLEEAIARVEAWQAMRDRQELIRIRAKKMRGGGGAYLRLEYRRLKGDSSLQ